MTMSDNTFSRRAALLGAAALPVAGLVHAQTRPRSVAISSANRNDGGINCCAKAMEVMKSGGDTLDAVIAGVNIVELDPRDNIRATSRSRAGSASRNIPITPSRPICRRDSRR